MSGNKSRNAVHACLIANARSGRGASALGDALAVLLRQGWDVVVWEKREKGEAAELARKAADDGYDPIVNCGGDGTLNEIVGALKGRDVAVGTIPGGTANVWSKEIGISARAEVAAMQLVVSDRARVDVGRVEINGKKQVHFLMMAGLGADGAVMGHVSRSLKNRLGRLAVGVAAVEALPAVRAFPIQVDLDGIRWEGRVTQLVAGNTRLYGGFTQITPQAYADDGLLDLCLFTTGGVAGTVQQMASIVLRRHPSPASTEQYRAVRIVVQAPEPLPLQVDGSAIRQRRKRRETHYEFSVLPGALTVLVPRTYGGGIFKHGIAPQGTNVHLGIYPKKKFEEA